MLTSTYELVTTSHRLKSKPGMQWMSLSDHIVKMDMQTTGQFHHA